MIYKKKQTLPIYLLMISPAMILFFLVIIFPIARSIWLGFTEYNVYSPSESEWVGLRNYIEIFSDALFWRAFKNNLFVIAISLFGQIPIALCLAYVLYRKFIRFRNFFLAMVFFPQTISTIIIGLLWRWLIINPHGVLSQLLKTITGNESLVFDLGSKQATAMIPIGLVLIWMYTGFYVLIFSANLQKINGGMIEAAEIDGASEWQIFKSVVLPTQMGAIVVSSILSIAGSLKGFDLIWSMTQGGPADYTIVLPIYMYKYAFQTGEIDSYSYGSAVATIIMLFSIFFIVISRWIGKKLEDRNE